MKSTHNKLTLLSWSLLIIFFLFSTLTNAAADQRGIGIEPISPTGSKVTGNQWLLVIGINTYIHWPRLETAVNDAKAVRDVLLDRYYFNEDHLVELYDENATRKNILNHLRNLAREVREDDSLVIFYAGHGQLDPITKEGSWVPVESGIDDPSAGISNYDIKNYLKIDAIKAKHVLLISDSCFSGDFFRGHRGKLPEVTEIAIKKAYNLTSRQAISSGGLEPVSDAGFGGNSVFSYFFVKALKDNNKAFFLPSDLYPTVRAGVAENAAQFPQYGSLSGTGGSQGGELVLFLKRDSGLDDLSAEVAERQKEFEKLKQMEAAAEEAQHREEEEIAAHEKELAALDAVIEAMNKRLGTSSVAADDSLDNMLAMVEQKEAQEQRLIELKRKKEIEERNRQEEIAHLKKEQEDKIIASLKPEVEKYKKIVNSKYGKNMKVAAWRSLLANVPAGWSEGVGKGDCKSLLETPQNRSVIDMKYFKLRYDSKLQRKPKLGNDRLTLNKGALLECLSPPDEKGWIKVQNLHGETGYVNIRWLAGDLSLEHIEMICRMNN